MRKRDVIKEKIYLDSMSPSYYSIWLPRSHAGAWQREERAGAVVRTLVCGCFLVALSAWGSLARASVITVGAGAGYDFSTLGAAITSASANDTVQVAAGTYTNDFVTINVPLTLESVGGYAVLEATVQIPNGKAIIVQNSALTITGFEFRGANVADQNGAGIRLQSGDLTVVDSIFRGNENGILTSSGAGIDVLIRNSQFIDNGFGDGYTHAIYAGLIDSLTVENSDFEGTRVGHDIKSRAAVTAISGNTLDDGVTGTASYAIDLPNGGSAAITGNIISQGADTENGAMIAYGAEGITHSANSLLVADNRFINSYPGTSIGVYNHSGISAQLVNNTFSDVDEPLRGPGEITGNVPAPSTLALLCLGSMLLRRRRA